MPNVPRFAEIEAWVTGGGVEGPFDSPVIRRRTRWGTIVEVASRWEPLISSGRALKGLESAAMSLRILYSRCVTWLLEVYLPLRDGVR